MADAKRDSNFVPTLLGVSSVDGSTPVTLYADPTTHRLYVDIPGGTGDVVGPASATDNALARYDTTTGKLIQNSTWTLGDNDKLALSTTNGEGLSIVTSKGTGAGTDNLLYLEATNSAWDRPMLRIIDATTSGGAANIRIDSPNPDIELVETDQVGTDGSGKFEIAINSDKFQINGRDTANSSFEPILTAMRYGVGGMVGIGTLYDTPNAMLEIVPTGTPAYYFAVSSAVGGTSGDKLKLDSTGLIINDGGSSIDFRVEGDTDANLLFTDGSTDFVGIGTNTPAQKLHVKGRAQFGVASNTSGTIDLANSSAAGLTRIAPGAPGSDVTFTLPAFSGTGATLAGTETFTNKRIDPRVVSAASYTTNTGSSLDVSTTDIFVITAQAGALLFNNPGGTPVQGQSLIIRIKDNGTARALTWDTQFRAMGIALPTTTVLSKTLYLGFFYNSTDTKWDLVASAQEA